MRRAWLFIAALAAASCGGDAPRSEPPPDLAFLTTEEIEKRRTEKDEWMRSDPESPLASAAREAFEGLEYYPLEENQRFKVRLDRYDDPRPLVMTTTEGELRPAVSIGKVRWDVDGQEHDLQVYQLRDVSKDQWGSLFLPFADETTGEETYPAGRYLELEPGPDGGRSGWYVLDFNLAYYPYCAYGRSGFRCPRTPEENRLPYAVRAGERGAL